MQGILIHHYASILLTNGQIASKESIENRPVEVSKILNLWVPLNYFNRVVMNCNKVLLQVLLDCCDNDLEINIENNT